MVDHGLFCKVVFLVLRKTRLFYTVVSLLQNCDHWTVVPLKNIIRSKALYFWIFCMLFIICIIYFGESTILGIFYIFLHITYILRNYTRCEQVSCSGKKFKHKLFLLEFCKVYLRFVGNLNKNASINLSCNF